MSESRLSDYLDHMPEPAQQACSSVEDWSKEDFLADKRTQQAVILSIVIIGEAATKLMNNHAEFVEQYSDITWRGMRGMRNRIAHGYFDIDLDVVWETVCRGIRRAPVQSGCGSSLLDRCSRFHPPLWRSA